MELEQIHILVVGAGVSGIAAAKLLTGKAKEIILYDSNEKLKEDEILSKLSDDFKGKIILGELDNSIKQKINLIILSPGVPTDLFYINEFRKAKIPILGEIELAYYFSKGKIAAITGTNGKTTTTALLGEILKTFYKTVFVVGNIGIPYTDMVTKTTDETITVAEMSSFQLETIEKFRPDVSVILNITPDHLDRHHTMEKYIEAKLNIVKNQTKSDTCILNYEDEVLHKVGREVKASVIYFSSARKLSKGIYLDENKIIYQDKEQKICICDVNELNIIGRHNYENAMAAAAAAIVLGVPIDCIYKGLISFQAVEHRIEYVATKHGVSYYNDSKGTNPDASIQAIKAMPSKTFLIAGGYDKGSDYTEWINAFEGKIKYLVLLGQTREKIAETAKKMGFLPIIMVDTMKEAVNFCSSHAQSGECVLLSPCCASWGMFKNYEERGKIFKDLVRTIE